jgi:hypothetical protein
MVVFSIPKLCFIISFFKVPNIGGVGVGCFELLTFTVVETMVRDVYLPSSLHYALFGLEMLRWGSLTKWGSTAMLHFETRWEPHLSARQSRLGKKSLSRSQLSATYFRKLRLLAFIFYFKCQLGSLPSKYLVKNYMKLYFEYEDMFSWRVGKVKFSLRVHVTWDFGFWKISHFYNVLFLNTESLLLISTKIPSFWFT